MEDVKEKKEVKKKVVENKVEVKPVFWKDVKPVVKSVQVHQVTKHDKIRKVTGGTKTYYLGDIRFVTVKVPEVGGYVFKDGFYLSEEEFNGDYTAG